MLILYRDKVMINLVIIYLCLIEINLDLGKKDSFPYILYNWLFVWMNNKMYLMAAMLAFASVGALLIHPILAAAQTPGGSAIDNILGTSNSPSTNAQQQPIQQQPIQQQPTPQQSSSNNLVPMSSSLSCGEVVKESVKLTSDLDCTSDALIVGADNIKIDLNGHKISGPGQTSSKVGVMFANSNGVALTGPGIITGFQAGVLISGGTNAKIDGVQFTANQISIFGTGSTNTQVTNNMMSNNGIAIAYHSSSGSSINYNMMKSNNLAGVTLVNSKYNILGMNTISGSANGVFIDGQSTNNTVNSNNVMLNTGVDINNANGLPTNINHNLFSDNHCATSVPRGLCPGRG